jgi:hypothetical protein
LHAALDALQAAALTLAVPAAVAAGTGTDTGNGSAGEEEEEEEGDERSGLRAAAALSLLARAQAEAAAVEATHALRLPRGRALFGLLRQAWDAAAAALCGPRAPCVASARAQLDAARQVSTDPVQPPI